MTVFAGSFGDSLWFHMQPMLAIGTVTSTCRLQDKSVDGIVDGANLTEACWAICLTYWNILEAAVRGVALCVCACVRV